MVPHTLVGTQHTYVLSCACSRVDFTQPTEDVVHSINTLAFDCMFTCNLACYNFTAVLWFGKERSLPFHQTVITSAVEMAMRMAVSKLATTLDVRISQRLREQGELSSTTSVACRTLGCQSGGGGGGAVLSTLSLPTYIHLIGGDGQLLHS